MKNLGNFSIEDERKLIKYSTHNFFASTRSWISPTFPFEDSNQKDIYLNSRKNINSMQTWAIDIPTFLNETIIKNNLESLKKVDKNYFVVLIAKEDSIVFETSDVNKETINYQKYRNQIKITKK